MIFSECSAQKELEYVKVSYLASSRGLYKDIELTEEKISVLEERSAKIRTEVEMSKNEWNVLLKHCRELPSQKASFDAEKLTIDAAIESTLTIKVKNQSENIEFKMDHSNLPVSFQPLINQILALSETVE